ncbi:PIR protein [Plasmodium vivax]|uniref:VIR protein n=1 Tax=Plasmodium vivax TaxID=5855 RepID=A0A565A3N5_PLAVI|nr:PIR protein [Plasmodium vivax]
MMFVFYPFLKEISSTYEYFDSTTEEGNNLYGVLCSNYILKQINEESNSTYRSFCIRLMKNLRYYTSDAEKYILTKERCNILFNWMHKLINEQSIKTNIINKCFEEYDREMKRIKNSNKCHYFRNIKIHEPINITLLDIFDNKMPTIEATLMDPDISNRAVGRKYVCECLKIYKDMNDKYCLNGKENREDNSSTCSKLKQFKKSYMLYLYNNSSLRAIIPSLDNIDKDLLDKCQEDEKRLRLDSDADETQLRYSANSLPTATEGQIIFSEERRTITHGNGDSSMKKTITTTIGTFAGASSLLAFLYKFTPAGRLVNPKLRRTTGIINNNFYGDDVNEHNGFNSYNIGYEAV